MHLFSYFCFMFLVFVLGLTSGAHIGQRQLPQSHNEHSSLGIINGTTVSITKYPFMASLKIDGVFFGSGVVIDKSWILTTAFNVAWFDKSKFEFRIGSNKLDHGGQVLIAQDVIYHENYTGTWDYNIAVVKVKPIKFNKKVNFIKMATQDAKGGLKTSVSGWGETEPRGSTSEVLLAANVTVFDWQKCKQNYTTDLTPRLICTYDLKQGPCTFDFGDPIVANNAVYGLFAGGYSCIPGKYPVLYANVPAFYDWVKEKISKYIE